MEHFDNVYEDRERARAYAQLDFPGTYYLAYRDLPALFQKYVQGTRALDFGCGTGRSTRFLESHGFATAGVDISAAMVEQARQKDPNGDYRIVTGQSLSDLSDRFDLILAAFTFDNIPTDAAKLDALRTLRRLLSADGALFLVVSSPDIYCNEWASFTTKDFPANQYAGDGDVVLIVMLDVPDSRPVEDIVCSDQRYRKLFENAGLQVRELVQPLATGSEPIKWVSETHTAPWSVYALGPA
jgi:ubiquinone/menaquinone biosynthesis C-methylase UbiE